MWTRVMMVALAAFPLFALAQEPVPAAVSDFGSSQGGEQTVVPANLTSDMPPVTFLENSGGNQLSMGISVGTAYDDNIFSLSSDHVNDLEYFVAPEISLQETRERVRWSVRYGAGLSGYTRSFLQRQQDHGFSGTVDYTPTARIRLHLRQDYNRSSDPLRMVERPLLGLVNSPNDTIVAPHTVMSTLTSAADVGYALSRHSNIGLSGTFAKTDYSDLVNGSTATNLLAGQTVYGSVYFSQQLSKRRSMGLQYVFQDISFDASPDTVHTHSMLFFHTVNFGTHSGLTLYAGPEFGQSRSSRRIQENATELTTRSGWRPSLGGSYSWANLRTAAGFSASRRISDGGGVMRAVTITSGTFSVSRKFTRRWTARSNCTLATNKSVDLAANVGTLRSLMAGASFERQFPHNIGMQVGYDRIYQHGTGGGVGYGNRNRVQLSLRYSFTTPLGK